MAYNYANNKEELIKRIRKNERGDYVDIKKITNQKGVVSIDVRNMYTTDDDEIRPTQKGVRFNSELAGDVIVALLKAVDKETLFDIESEVRAIMEFGTDIYEEEEETEEYEGEDYEADENL